LAGAACRDSHKEVAVAVAQAGDAGAILQSTEAISALIQWTNWLGGASMPAIGQSRFGPPSDKVMAMLGEPRNAP
jgi:hypothetical protein